VSGLSINETTRAENMVKAGDIFLFYLVRLSRWCGALQVIGGTAVDDIPLFNKADDPYAVRFRVKLLAARQLNNKKISRQQGLVQHPYNQKDQTCNGQDRQIPAKHRLRPAKYQLRQVPQPLTPCEFYPGSLAFPADVFPKAVPVAILAFNSSATGGTNSRHIRTVQKIGGFPPLLIGTQLKCACPAAQFVAHIRMSQVTRGPFPLSNEFAVSLILNVLNQLKSK
jgi:hypothetical protein